MIRKRPPSHAPVAPLLIGMSFGLCNTPATFQRCMMSIFSDMVENIIEVFMEDFLSLWKIIRGMSQSFGESVAVM